MKLKLLILLLFFFLFSCDEFPEEEDPAGPPPSGKEPGEPNPPEVIHPDCLSITGERYEKYYLELDQSILDSSISLRSPKILGYVYNGGHAFNEIVLDKIPLKNFIELTPFTCLASGTVAVSGRHMDSYIAFSYPFTDIEVNLLPIIHQPDYEKDSFDVLSSYSNKPGELTLPYTGNYLSAYIKHQWRTFSMAISSDFLRSLINTDSFSLPFGVEEDNEEGIELTHYKINNFYSCDLICENEAFVLLVPESRNFYQYASLTAVFSPDITISNVKTSSIVSSFEYSQSKNALTVFFNYYDAPYTGDVISYETVDEEGSIIKKYIRIEGMED